MSTPVVLFSFTKEEVARCAFDVFPADLRGDKMPVGSDLKGLMGKFAPLIEGYNDDPREVYTIPEIRKFWRAFHDEWPYWLFFFLADIAVMGPMMYCRLDKLEVLHLDGQENCVLRFDKKDVADILRADFEPMNELCDRAGMSDSENYDRTASIFRVFGLPFDAKRP